jgi:hypothetical protein
MWRRRGESEGAEASATTGGGAGGIIRSNPPSVAQCAGAMCNHVAWSGTITTLTDPSIVSESSVSAAPAPTRLPRRSVPRGDRRTRRPCRHPRAACSVPIHRYPLCRPKGIVSRSVDGFLRMGSSEAISLAERVMQIQWHAAPSRCREAAHHAVAPVHVSANTRWKLSPSTFSMVRAL